MNEPRWQSSLMWYWLTAAALALLAVQPAARGKAIVDLRPASVVRGEEVYLRDVAEIQGAGKAQKELLGSVLLGRSPAYARSNEFRQSYILAKMRQNLIDMEAVVVRGPESIEVRADGSLLAGKRLAQLAEAHILEQTGWNRQEVRFDWGRLPADCPLPPGKVSIDVWKVSGDFYGLTSLRSDIRVDAQSVVSVPMVVKVHRYATVLVAKGDLERGRVIEAGDFQVCRRDLSTESARVRKSYCRLDQPPVGKRLKSYVQAGRTLVYDMLTDPPIVERGERVVIEIRRGDVYVTAQGEARASAAVGETIPVKNYVSDKTIMARVVRPGAVTVE